MQSILMGSQTGKDKVLTHKQLRFAEELAKGKTKAGAYRAAYDSKGKPVTQSRRGQEVAAMGAVSAQVEAFKLAIEAARYATPAALRALVIERLTCHAIDSDIPPAQRLRALELLGKVTEVAAFTERREIITSDSTESARDKLLSSLRLAIQSPANPVGSMLLEELRRSRIGAINHEAIDVDASESPEPTEHSEAAIATTPVPDPPLFVDQDPGLLA
jgi:hypothetical protein